MDKEILAKLPFNLLWEKDLVDKFLEDRGYVVFTREETGEWIAAKKEESYLDPVKNNAISVFNRELQISLLKLLNKEQ